MKEMKSNITAKEDMTEEEGNKIYYGDRDRY